MREEARERAAQRRVGVVLDQREGAALKKQCSRRVLGRARRAAARRARLAEGVEQREERGVRGELHRGRAATATTAAAARGPAGPAQLGKNNGGAILQLRVSEPATTAEPARA